MKNENVKSKNKLSKLIYILLFLSTIIFVGAVYYLDVLPIKYFSVIVCFAVFILGLFALILLNKRIKKKWRFIFSFIAILIIIVMALVSKYALSTIDVINAITQKINYKTENYSVIVLKDNNAQEIQDIENKTLGYLDNETTGMKKALSTLKKEVNTENEAYEDLLELENDLLDEEIEAIVLEDSFKAIVEEENETFANDTKVIYTFSVKVPEEKKSKNVDVTKEPFNIYLSGIDTYGKISSVSRSDVNIIATINPKTGKVLLTSIPRDYYVQLHGTTGLKDKLTHAGIYGVDKSVSTIEDLLDISINYYVKVNFTSLINIVDTLGSITVYSDYNFVSKDGYRYVKGNNTLNGKKALSFARERYAFSEGDRQRGLNQMYVIEAIADELMSYNTITKYEDILDTIKDNFETNLSSDEISKLIKLQIDKNIKWNIEKNSLDGTGASQNTYTYKSSRSYVMIPDETSVASAKTKISKIMNEE